MTFRRFLWFPLLLLLLMAQGCMKWEDDRMPEGFDTSGPGLFIACEGNFQYGNASLSFYDPASRRVENEVFFRANGMKLGDVAQSMTIHGERGWIAVNNSHVIFAIDVNTFRETGRIENVASPRYILFLSDEKAYVSQLWDNRIFIINPRTYSVTGYIQVPDMAMETGSTEQMVLCDGYVYCTCWSYQNRILKIDPATDRIVAVLTVGIQPSSIAVDREKKLWVLTDGGYEGSPYGYEAPTLLRIDPQTLAVERRLQFPLGSTPSELQTDGTGTTLYWLNDAVWRMNISSATLPATPFLESRRTKYYGLTVDPAGGDVYVADAIDYQQQGMIYRYTSGGELIDEFYVGITPGAFCWKK